jgi:hypothetical protein
LDLGKPEVIQLPLPSASLQSESCPDIHARLGDSIRERVVVQGLAVIRNRRLAVAGIFIGSL